MEAVAPDGWLGSRASAYCSGLGVKPAKTTQTPSGDKEKGKHHEKQNHICAKLRRPALLGCVVPA